MADTAPADRAFAEASADADLDYEHDRGVAEREKQEGQADANFAREEGYWPEHTILETAKANADETRADSKADAQKTLATQQALAEFDYAQIEAQVARDKVQPIAQKEVQVDLKNVALEAAKANQAAQETYAVTSARPLSEFEHVVSTTSDLVEWLGVGGFGLFPSSLTSMMQIGVAQLFGGPWGGGVVGELLAQIAPVGNAPPIAFYVDFNFTFALPVGITGGIVYDSTTGWHPYIGPAVGTPGASVTISPGTITPGWTTGGSVFFDPPIGGQVGYSWGPGGGWFFEIGVGTSLGWNISHYYVF